LGWRDARLGEDGARRCSTCHLAYLRAHAAHDSDRCADGRTVGEHKAGVREMLARAAWRWRRLPASDEPAT
jgi:hypothetical protein